MQGGRLPALSLRELWLPLLLSVRDRRLQNVLVRPLQEELTAFRRQGCSARLDLRLPREALPWGMPHVS